MDPTVPSTTSLFPTIAMVTTLYVIYKMADFLLRLPTHSRTDKYVLVTGCDMGFGRHLVESLAGAGCHVIATCVTSEGEQELGALGANVQAIRMDVTKPESIREAYRHCMEFIPKDKGLWGIVNNAGISGTLCPSEWLRREDFTYVLQVNALGMVDVVNTFLPLVTRSGGRVVNMSSVLGRLAIPYSAPYCMSKFAVQAYTAALRLELSGSGVSVHMVEPGAVRTNFTNAERIKNLSRTAWDRLSEDKQQEYGPAFVDNMVGTGMALLDWTMSSTRDHVISAYEHALFSWFPKRRYVLGLDSIGYLLLSYCPDWVTELGFRASGLILSKPQIKSG